MVPVKAGQPRIFPPSSLGTTSYGSFFPDGSKFAFVGAAPGHGARLYVQAVSGGDPKPISAEGMAYSRIYVSPDGRFVAATGPDQLLHLYPTAGGAPTDLASSRAGDVTGAFTADGKGMYVSNAGVPCPLDLIDLASGTRTHVRDLNGADSAGVVTFGPARVTPDGKTIVAGYSRILSTLYRVTELR
jgi:Tol biopolymer transport system component